MIISNAEIFKLKYFCRNLPSNRGDYFLSAISGYMRYHVGRSVGRSKKILEPSAVVFFVVFFFVVFFFDRRSSQRPSPIFISKIPSAVPLFPGEGKVFRTSGLRGKGVTPKLRIGKVRSFIYYIVQIFSFECFLKILKLRFLSFGT